MPPCHSPRALDPYPVLTLAAGGADVSVTDAIQEQVEKEAKKAAKMTKKAIAEAKKVVKVEQEAKRKMAVKVLREAEKLIREKERAKVANNLVLPAPATPVFSTAGRSASQSPGPMGIASQSPSPTARECSASQSPLAGLTSKYFLTYVPLTI